MENILPHSRTNKVLLIYTGGTIGMGCNPRTGALEPLDFNNLVSNLPEMEYLRTGIDVHQFTEPIDSSDVCPRTWAQLVEIISSKYDAYDGFVILHGTDTMAYTASALSFLLENLTKPVILTGSQLPLGQLRTDGKENLVTSIELASTYGKDGRPMVPEVCIYFSGKLLRGNRSTKQNADGFDAFDSFNYPHLCEAGVTFSFNRHQILKPDFSRPLIPHYNVNPKLLKALQAASNRGVTIVNISQCVAGSVEMSRYDTGYQLQQAGVISGRDSTVEAAATKLMYLHAQYHDDAEVIRKIMEIPIAGEITV